VPTAAVIGMLVNPTSPGSERQERETQARNEKCANPILGKGSEDIINIALAASLENMKLLPKGLRRRGQCTLHRPAR
jgi:hypothetical protein